MLIALVSALAGFILTPAETVDAAEAAAGADLARLLKAMAVIKLAFVLPAALAVIWRLSLPVSVGRLVAYAAATAAMTISIGLIWHLAHVGLGALLMHAGLISTLILLFTDKDVVVQLSGMLARRAT